MSQYWASWDIIRNKHIFTAEYSFISCFWIIMSVGSTSARASKPLMWNLCCRSGHGRRTCGRRRRVPWWRGTRWSRVSLRPRAEPSSPPSPSTTSWSPTSTRPTTAPPGTPSARAPWSSPWRKRVRMRQKVNKWSVNASCCVIFIIVAEKIETGKATAILPALLTSHSLLLQLVYDSCYLRYLKVNQALL